MGVVLLNVCHLRLPPPPQKKKKIIKNIFLGQLYCPVYPDGHAHVYPLGSLCRVRQVPPFLHGFLNKVVFKISHSLTLKSYRNSLNGTRDMLLLQVVRKSMSFILLNVLVT